jgi:hypothetical protein
MYLVARLLRTWSRFTKMSECRLNRKIFLWSNRISFSKVRNWNYRVNTKFKDQNLNQYWNIECILSKGMITHVENIMFTEYQDKWKNDLFSNVNSKLRTYRLFKIDYLSQIFVTRNICVLICLVNIEVLMQSLELVHLGLKLPDMKD